MTELLELAKVVDSYKLRQLEVLTRPLRPGVQETRYRIMYHALINDQVRTETEAAHLLGLDAKGRPFRRFLLEFRRRLYPPLLFLDTDNSPHFNETQKANFYCLRRMALFKSLLYRNCLENARVVAEEVVELATQYDVTLVALEAATFLKNYYITQYPSREKHFYYKAYTEQFRHNWTAENKALQSLQAVVAPAVKKKSNQSDLAQKARELLTCLESYVPDCSTILFFAGYYGVKLTEKMSLYRWDKAAEICDSALSQLQEKPCSSPRIIGFFLINKATCLAMLGKYQEALSLNLENASLEIEGSRGWFATLEVQVSVALKAGEYALALNCAEQVFLSPKFSLMPRITHETWQILFAYIVVIQLIGKIDHKATQSDLIHKFKLIKFLNNVPIYSKDKRGLNISILLVQLLFLMHQKDYASAQERLEALRKYRVKYFRVDAGNYRTQLFLKAITTMAGSTIRKNKFVKKSQPYISLLSETPIGHPDQHYRIEVIPYETMWRWIIEMIDE